MTRLLIEKLLSFGIAQHKAGRYAEAEATFRDCLAQAPEEAQAHALLAESLLHQGRHDDALAPARRAVALDGKTAALRTTLGLVLRMAGYLKEAASELTWATKLDPGDASAWNNLGIVSAYMGLDDKALGYYLNAIRLNPRYAEALSNLATLLSQRRDHTGAVDCLRRAIDLEPAKAALWNNLGVALDEKGERQEAIQAFRTCLKIDPGHAAARCGLGMSLLAQGDLREGFAAYEARWRRFDMPPRPFSQPLWQGEELGGKTLLLHAEQCLGDTLQFIRYAPLAAQRAGRLILECQPALKPLLASLQGVDELIACEHDPLPPFDAHLPLMSLPCAFATTLETVPSAVPYLKADAAMAEQFRRSFAAQPGLKVGIAWRGNAKYQGTDWRSPGIGILAALCHVPGVRFVCLQMGGRAEFLEAFGQAALDLGHEVDALTPPFVETAALMEALDLVISSDTSVPHLAGALGRPTWLLLPYPAEWRWLEVRRDSPWYPSMRLFRQGQGEEWEAVGKRLAEELAEMANKLDSPVEKG